MHVDVDKLSVDLQAYVFPRLVPPGVVASPDVRRLRDSQGPCRGSSQRFESVYTDHLGIKVQGLREGFLGIPWIYRDLLSAAHSRVCEKFQPL